MLSCDLCSDPGGRCPRCEGVVLCNACLPKHSRNKRCLPWGVSRQDPVGRCLLAIRDIQPLEIVLADSAVAIVPQLGVSCMGCGRSVNCLYTCPKCNSPLCGPTCPHLYRHAPECSILSLATQPLSVTDEVEQHVMFPTAGVLRMLQLKESDQRAWQLVDRLMDHGDKNQLKKQAEEVLDLLNLCGKIYEEGEVRRSLGLLKINSFGVDIMKGGHVRALFPLQALVTHSCVPNCQHLEKEGGEEMVVQAVTKITKGSLLTVRYAPFLQGRISLRKRLKENWYFTCMCPRCIDGTELGTFTSSALCLKPGCKDRGGLLLPVDPTADSCQWICSSCQSLTSEEKVEKMEQDQMLKFNSLKKSDLQNYYNFMNLLGERFHSSHHLVMRMAQFLVLVQGQRIESLSRERIETQSMLCSKLLAFVSVLDPGATHQRAKLLLEKNKADLNIAKMDCEAGIITRKAFLAKIKEGVKIEVNAKKILYFKWDC